MYPAGMVAEEWAGWVRRWGTDIDDAARRLMDGFQALYGFPHGENSVRWATGTDLDDARRLADDPLMPRAMAAFYTVIAEVSLPDVANGYFIHPASSVLAQRDLIGYVFLPESDDPHGLLIGSDGGGIQCVADWSGAVHRSTTATLDGEFRQVAETVEQFLDLVRHAVIRFVDHNNVTPCL